MAVPPSILRARAMRVRFREEPCKVALSRVKRMPFEWSLNPYMGCEHRCTFCYVRGFEQRADRAWGEAYGRSIRVKTNIVEVLRAELARARVKRGGIALGSATDPYQPAEGTYRLTRRCIRVLGEARAPFNIITRGPMIVRDIDVLREAARRTDVSVAFSVPTQDLEVWRRTEPGTAPPRQRLRALRALVDAGIKAGVAIAPILPGISDRPEQLREAVRAARDAGATDLWVTTLRLAPGTREYFLEALARDWPEQAARYERLYARGAYAQGGVARAIEGRVRRLAGDLGIADRREAPVEPPPTPEQLALFEVA